MKRLPLQWRGKSETSVPKGEIRRIILSAERFSNYLCFRGNFNLRVQVGLNELLHRLDGVDGETFLELVHLGGREAVLVQHLELLQERGLARSRSEERRGGQECVSTGRSRWGP